MGGSATQNRFGASKTLATSQVRAAGRHRKSQGEVWAKVGDDQLRLRREMSPDQASSSGAPSSTTRITRRTTSAAWPCRARYA